MKGTVRVSRSGGSRRRRWAGWPGWAPGLLPVGDLVTGLGASGGLAEGGVEELVALAPRRAVRSRTSASSSATRRFRSAISSSRCRQPGHATSVMETGYEHGKRPAGPRRRVNGYNGFSRYTFLAAGPQVNAVVRPRGRTNGRLSGDNRNVRSLVTVEMSADEAL